GEAGGRRIGGGRARGGGLAYGVVSSPRRPRGAAREPVRPRMPAALEPAVPPEHDLADELALRQLEFVDLDLSGRGAASVDITQCRFTRATPAGAILERAALT